MSSRRFALGCGAGLAVTVFLATTYVFGAVSGALPSRPELPAYIQAAKADFRPLTTADLQQAKARLIAAANRLDAKTARAGQNGDGWRQYVQLRDLEEQLRKPGAPDTAVLTAVYKKFSAGYEGLELVWFAELRDALGEYLELAGVIGNPALKTAYEQTLDRLAEQVKGYLAQPTAEGAYQIGQSLKWLRSAKQAPGVVAAIRAHFTYSNFFLQIGGNLLSSGIAGPVDQTDPVQDCILGTSISGTGRTVGATTVRLTSSADFAMFDVLLRSTTHSRTTGVNGPVCIQSQGTTCIGAAKRFWLDAGGLFALPATAQAVTDNTILDLQAKRRIIERIGWKRAGKQEAEAEAIASQHAEQRVNERIDREAVDMLQRTNERYAQKVRAPLADRRVFPDQLNFSTTASALQATGVQMGPYQLAAPTSPVLPTQPADLGVQLHESAVNNMANTALAGMVLTEAGFQSAIQELLGRVPDRLKPDEEKEPWKVEFAAEEPISVKFADEGLAVTIRGKRWHKGDSAYPGMNVTAVYKFVKTDRGYKLVRQGDVQVFPPGFVPGAGRQLSGREQLIRTPLEKRFSKMFPPEATAEGFALSGRWAAAGKLQPVELVGRVGWLVIGWRQTGKPVEQPAATSGK